jgi:uncharacterized membrane protein YeaQ/YmgE (transglycosylase-associated protein family)
MAMQGKERRVTALAVATSLVFPSVLVGWDTLTEPFCSRAPLYAYLVLLVVGTLCSPWLARWIRRSGKLEALLVGLVGLAVLGGVSGATWLATHQTRWDTKCAFRYCYRALKPGLDRSPYPVDPPSCSALHMCANEAVLDDDEQTRLLRKLQQQNCAEP